MRRLMPLIYPNILFICDLYCILAGGEVAEQRSFISRGPMMILFLNHMGYVNSPVSSCPFQQ